MLGVEGSSLNIGTLIPIGTPTSAGPWYARSPPSSAQE
ncbi:hypothetical protein D187_009661 [Cystobacter fuscus DSM 2262]|uniref:Uncharacterized protein n=1 Tax=Cystobacter fuscus (strain ATCC 25194 / DSM 2262 / NBRC 100088 / M29) TaxID=1242864 RepID=S9NSU4_CYSF2|nr:hypothetical protein D187_009661 [Cystobacter fuscus DSM 2262]